MHKNGGAGLSALRESSLTMAFSRSFVVVLSTVRALFINIHEAKNFHSKTMPILSIRKHLNLIAAQHGNGREKSWSFSNKPDKQSRGPGEPFSLRRIGGQGAIRWISWISLRCLQLILGGLQVVGIRLR